MDALAPGHLLIIAAVAFLLFFGWKQLPDMSRSLGRSLRIFRTEMKGFAADGQAVRATVEDTKRELGDTVAATRASVTIEDGNRISPAPRA
jgi:sec-independent protein translocase protein TatA